MSRMTRSIERCTLTHPWVSSRSSLASQAEIYHQYHNDFQDKPYGKAYNDLANLALQEGRLRPTGCPDRV